MNRDAMVRRRRPSIEADMTSRATIRRRSGLPVQNETTGRETPGWIVTHTNLPFRLGGTRGDAPSRTLSTGGVDVQLAVRTGHMPASTPNIRDGDLIEVTVGENAGTVWRVVEAERQDASTALRLPIIATARPGEWV